MSINEETSISDRPKAVVIGVGPEQGLGAGLSRRFAAKGRHVVIAGRTEAKIERVRESIVEAGGSASTVVMDATSEADVIRLFDVAMKADEHGGSADLIAYNAGNNQPLDLRTMEADVFESFWRLNCFGGFLVGREAARRFAPLGRGSILFSGARSEACQTLPTSRRARPACACSLKAWPANSARSACTSPMS
jgi:NAD(P)-dependent dehydrogenase (short-subunit alcohol dehydrogenase family)